MEKIRTNIRTASTGNLAGIKNREYWRFWRSVLIYHTECTKVEYVGPLLLHSRPRHSEKLGCPIDFLLDINERIILSPTFG